MEEFVDEEGIDVVLIMGSFVLEEENDEITLEIALELLVWEMVAVLVVEFQAFDEMYQNEMDQNLD